MSHAAPAETRAVPAGMSSAAVCDQDFRPGAMRCHSRILVSRGGQPFITAQPSGFGPASLQSAYGITSPGDSSVTIAIVDAFGYANAETDLGVYRSTFGLSACTTANGCFTKLNQRGVQGSYPADNLSWAQETALDLDMVSAICPNCKILLVEADDNFSNNLGAAVNTAAGLSPHAISNSYGGPEAGSQAFEADYNHPGIAITASTGDDGFGVATPAAYPEVIAVGGTSLFTAANSRGWTETAWSGAGSGCSTLYAKPVWQTDSGCTNRTVADVSAVADPNTGVAVYAPVTGGGTAFQVFGGTSASSPIIAAIYGLNDRAVSFAHDIYQQTTSLNDVTSGSNGACSGSYLCTAGTGYDGPTGLGTPAGSTAFGTVPAAPSPLATTYVSGTIGDDANDCSRATPCATFNHALSQTLAEGEIDCLDSGDYGPVTITQPVSIVCRNVTGGILSPSTTGIVVNLASASGRVQLIGLDINGGGTGIDGVRTVGLGNVTIIDCTIFGFKSGGASHGVNLNSNAHVLIENTVIRGNDTGVNIDPGSVGNSAVIDRSVLESNSVNALSVTIRGTAVVSNSTLAGSPTAIHNTGGSVVSYGKNVIRNAGTPTQTLPLN